MLPPTSFARAADPFLPLRGWRAFARSLSVARQQTSAAWIGTTSYGLTAELADEAVGVPVVQISERDRWRGLNLVSPALLRQPGLIVDLPRRLDPAKLRACFSDIRAIGGLERGAPGERATMYTLYRVADPVRDISRHGCWND